MKFKKAWERGDNLEIEISQELYQLLLLQSAESGLTVDELISYAFGNYIKESDKSGG